MTTPNFFKVPPKLPNGTILGAAYLSWLDDNDRYLRGIIDRRRTPPFSVQRAYIGTEESLTIWDGWHYLDAEATLLHYDLKAGSDDTDYPTTLSLYYDGSLIVAATANAVNGNPYRVTSTYDLSAKDPGLYSVQAILTRPNGNYNGYGLFYPPWTSYTGSESYASASGTWIDAAPADPSDFDQLVDNDAYFAVNIPWEPAGMAVANMAYENDTLAQVVWKGADIYDSHCKRIYYKMGGYAYDSGDLYLQITYDAESTEEQLLPIEPPHSVNGKPLTTSWQDWEGYVDISGSYTPGTTYSIEIRMYRANTGQTTGEVTVEYVFIGPATPAAMNDPGARTVGAYVYGSGAGGGYETLQYLAENDVDINGEMVRRDWAVKIAEELPALGHYGTWTYYFRRRGDFLYYRGIGAKVLYANGEKSASLRDTEDSDYLIQDLNSIAGLHPGMEYWIEGAIEFAVEI